MEHKNASHGTYLNSMAANTVWRKEADDLHVLPSAKVSWVIWWTRYSVARTGHMHGGEQRPTHTAATRITLDVVCWCSCPQTNKVYSMHIYTWIEFVRQRVASPSFPPNLTAMQQ